MDMHFFLLRHFAYLRKHKKCLIGSVKKCPKEGKKTKEKHVDLYLKFLLWTLDFESLSGYLECEILLKLLRGLHSLIRL